MSSFLRAAVNAVSRPDIFILHLPVIGRLNEEPMNRLTRVAREYFLWGAACGFFLTQYRLFEENFVYLGDFEGTLLHAQTTVIETAKGGIQFGKTAVTAEICKICIEKLLF